MVQRFGTKDTKQIGAVFFGTLIASILFYEINNKVDLGVVTTLLNNFFGVMQLGMLSGILLAFNSNNIAILLFYFYIIATILKLFFLTTVVGLIKLIGYVVVFIIVFSIMFLLVSKDKSKELPIWSQLKLWYKICSTLKIEREEITQVLKEPALLFIEDVMKEDKTSSDEKK